VSPVTRYRRCTVTGPMVAFVADESWTVRSKRRSPCTVAPGPITMARARRAPIEAFTGWLLHQDAAFHMRRAGDVQLRSLS